MDYAADALENSTNKMSDCPEENVTFYNTSLGNSMSMSMSRHMSIVFQNGLMKNFNTIFPVCRHSDSRTTMGSNRNHRHPISNYNIYDNWQHSSYTKRVHIQTPTNSPEFLYSLPGRSRFNGSTTRTPSKRSLLHFGQMAVWNNNVQIMGHL